MRVVRQILVGLGLIVIGVGAGVAAQGIISWTQPGVSQPESVEAIAIAILGALLLIGGTILLIKGIRRRPIVADDSGTDVARADVAGADV
ncbi:MAG TPA: hypothetical protein VFU63_13905 [Ktedonobacterales bacterium]|nr:hypothetical protein [Ktedonobacterales bacterium]